VSSPKNSGQAAKLGIAPDDAWGKLQKVMNALKGNLTNIKPFNCPFRALFLK
jgi:hypothetical protein